DSDLSPIVKMPSTCSLSILDRYSSLKTRIVRFVGAGSQVFRFSASFGCRARVLDIVDFPAPFGANMKLTSVRSLITRGLEPKQYGASTVIVSIFIPGSFAAFSDA